MAVIYKNISTIKTKFSLFDADPTDKHGLLCGYERRLMSL